MKDNNINIKDIHSNTSAMDEDDSGNVGLERFDERLKFFSRKKNSNSINKEEIVNKYKDKVSVYIPRHVGVEKNKQDTAVPSNINIDNNNNATKKEQVNKYKDNVDIYKTKSVGVNTNSKIKTEDIDNSFKAENIDVNKTKNVSIDNDSKFENVKKNNKSKSKYVGIITRKNVSGLSKKEKDERLSKLEKEILLGLDKKLKLEIDNLKSLVSEQDDIVDTLSNKRLISKEEIQEKIERLEEILHKIKKSIEQIEILNNNYRFEDIINLSELNDQSIINNIVEYRDILESNSERSKDLSDKYKLLDSFIILYREVYIKEELLKHNYKKANDKKEKVEDRNKKYIRLKDDINVIEQVDKDCKLIIDKQNEYLKALNNRISNIDSHLVTRYRFDGANTMLLTMLMYISIMNKLNFSDSKVKDTTATLATGRLFGNIRKNKKSFVNPAVKGVTTAIFANQMFKNVSRNKLHTVNKIEYSADDLSNELYNYLDDVEILSNFIQNTLEEIQNMKTEFVEEFKGKIPGYEELEEKINLIESSILENKRKLLSTQNTINSNIELNNRKLLRVKELNQGTI